MTQPAKELKLPELVDLETIAHHLGVTPRHVRRLVAERRIPYVKWGRLLRFDPADVARWVDASRRPAQARRPTPRVASRSSSPTAPGRSPQTLWSAEDLTLPFSDRR